MDIRSQYLECVLDKKKRQKVLKKTVDVLRKHRKKFDTIVFCGMSGALVAPVVADRLRKGMMLVRKKSDNRHSTFEVEGVIPERYVIVDDLVDSCSTVQFIIEKIAAECPAAKCVGLLLYDQTWRDKTWAKEAVANKTGHRVPVW